MATRHERVVLTLEDNFTTSAAKAAAATSLINRELKSLSGAAVTTHRPLQTVAGDVDKVSSSARRGQADLDRFSGRLTILRDVGLALGPAFVPIGAVAVPAVAGLAAQLGAAALAGGTAIAAFQGVGDALEAFNDAQLEPTAANLEKAREAMQNISPVAQRFVLELQQMRPALRELRDSAAAGMFPGLLDGMNELEGVLPDVERLLFTVGEAAGGLGADLGEAFASERGREFLAFLRTEMPPTLTTLGHAVGNITAGLSELWIAFTPLNRDFSDWMLQAARGFDEWASGLAQTEGFREFVAYVRESGPRVADAMGAIGNALLQVVEAAAPLGGPVLAALEAVADVIGAIADSDYGPALFGVAAALAGVSRAMKAFEAIKATSLFTNLAAEASGVTGSLTRLQRAAVLGGGALVVAAAGVAALQRAFAEELPGMNELTGQLLSLSEGNVGALAEEFDSLGKSIGRITDPLIGERIGDSLFGLVGLETRRMGNATDEIEALDEALTNLVSSAGAETAEKAFENLARSQGLTADETRRLREILPGYRDALEGAANEARFLGDEVEGSTDGAVEGFKKAKTAAQQFKSAIEDANRVLDNRASLRDYEQAIDDFLSRGQERADILKELATAERDLARADTGPEKRAARERIESLKEQAAALENSLDTTTQAGRDTEAALDNIIQTTIRVAEGMKGTNRVEFLRQARRDFVDATAKLLGGRDKARELWDELSRLDKVRASPIVEVKTARAQGDVKKLLNALADLRDKTVTVTTVFTSSGRRFKEFDTGGFTGWGGKYEPRGIVHAGEVVIPQHLVKRDWAMLKSRYGSLPGFANGGYVDERVFDQRTYDNRTTSTAMAEQIDYSRLATELSRVRPMYGDVHISGDPTTFKRQMLHDRQRAGGGGMPGRF